jgi:hypothetical protein
MKTREKKLFLLFIIFGAIAFITASLPELGLDYFSGYDGLGRGIFIALFVTFPAGLLALLFLFLWLAERYRRKHSDI